MVRTSPGGNLIRASHHTSNVRVRLAAFFVIAILATSATAIVGATGLLPVNPIVNGDFDQGYIIGGLTPLHSVLDRCVGIGHQVLGPLYSPWADWAFAHANAAADDPTSVAALATDPATPGQATTYPLAYAGRAAADPNSVHACDANDNEITEVNPWGTIHDRGVGWSNDPGTTFADYNGDGDVEAIIPPVPTKYNHDLWQSTATTTQAFSADFDSFQFSLEAGSIAPGANIQVGFSLSPSYTQHPFVGIFWEGAVLFTSSDMVKGADGVVRLNPIAQGEIICPAGYSPCLRFQSAYAASDGTGKATLLGQTRVVQTSFWAFNNPAGNVVIDNIAYVGAKSAAETKPHAGPV